MISMIKSTSAVLNKFSSSCEELFITLLFFRFIYSIVFGSSKGLYLFSSGIRFSRVFFKILDSEISSLSSSSSIISNDLYIELFIELFFILLKLFELDLI